MELCSENLRNVNAQNKKRIANFSIKVEQILPKSKYKQIAYKYVNYLPFYYTRNKIGFLP